MQFIFSYREYKLLISCPLRDFGAYISIETFRVGSLRPGRSRRREPQMQSRPRR